MDNSLLSGLIARYKDAPDSVYNTWFVNGEERMKAFRSIRRGVKDTVDAIAAGKFGNDFKGSPLEVVLTAITEQKEVFEGAAHPFYWKPKLRIPDIYENEANKRKFGSFLQACLTATREDQVLAEMRSLGDAQIKGLGPAVASIIYFLHPTIVPPFNTAMVNGFNALFSEKKKLGSWTSYLELREVVVHSNEEVKHLLSKDLGAFAGLLFEIGSGKLLPSNASDALLQQAKDKANKAVERRRRQADSEKLEESAHTRVQHQLIRIGRALKYDVFVARNDRHRSCDGESFALLTLPDLPPSNWPADVLDTVRLIDVIWLKPSSGDVVAAFEIEKSTSIYSGILRLEDLARSLTGCSCHLYLVAPDQRESEVMAQLARPAFRDDLHNLSLSFIPFNDLHTHCNSLCKLGDDHTILRKIARTAAHLTQPIGSHNVPAPLAHEKSGLLPSGQRPDPV